MIPKKIAIITGGSRGLGRSAALHLAKQNVAANGAKNGAKNGAENGAEGVAVLITFHTNHDEAMKTVAEIERAGGSAAALRLDVSNSAEFADFVVETKKLLLAKWKRADFDYLVNNAGTGLDASFAETSEAQFDQLVNVHLKGTFFLTQHLLPLMKDGGRILNLSTGLTRFCSPGRAAYAAVKGAVEVLTRYMAFELGARKISVNTLAPGPIETDFGGGLVRDNKQMNAYLASVTALGRVGLPDDVGAAVAGLLKDPSGWINAQRIEVSGGAKL